MSDSTTTDRKTAENIGNKPSGAPAAPAGNSGADAAPSGSRKRMLALLAAAVVASGAAFSAYYFMYGQYYEATDDAYVNGNLVQVTPLVTGTVIAVNADDTQTVHEGEPLVELDPADAKIALSNAESNLAQTVRRVSSLYVNNDYYAANIAQREADLARARDDLQRRAAVAGTGAVSAEDLDHARDMVNIAQAALDAAREQAQANQALTGRTTIEQHPDVLAAASKVRDAYLWYARNTLPAPVTGYVAQRYVQVGQRVSPGTPLMAIVPLNGVWVDANFKEVQLERMRIGQPVTLTADVYGSSVKYHGHIEGFSAGTGAAFATLPAQNATGNWIKIVQRLPVRVLLDPSELKAHPLRIGLSMQVDVDTHNESGTQLGSAVNTSYRTDVFAKVGDQANAEIEKIIQENEVASQTTPAQPVAKSAAPHDRAKRAG
jgi:membrane fusion protein (multidrug efflux system)